MANVTERIDVRTGLTNWLEVMTGMTCADIQAIPDDKWTATFGGCTRPANLLLADTVTNLRWTTAVLKGETSTAYEEGMGNLAAQLTSKADGIAALNEASSAFREALNGASDEILNSSVMAPWQMPTPVIMLAHIAVSHVWYHDGQFNYIQCLLGDDKIHWMGG